jgi:hypothetical protein
MRRRILESHPTDGEHWDTNCFGDPGAEPSSPTAAFTWCFKDWAVDYKIRFADSDRTASSRLCTEHPRIRYCRADPFRRQSVPR